jgi:hypothetical protein
LLTSLSKRVKKLPLRAALMRSIRIYHTRQRTGCVGASAQSYDICAASSVNQYFTSEVPTSNDQYRYFFAMEIYEDGL